MPAIRVAPGERARGIQSDAKLQRLLNRLGSTAPCATVEVTHADRVIEMARQAEAAAARASVEQPDFPEQRLEARVGSQLVEVRVNAEP